MAITFSDTNFADGVQARNFLWTLSNAAELRYPDKDFNDPLYRLLKFGSVNFTKLPNTNVSFVIGLRRLANGGASTVGTVLYGRFMATGEMTTNNVNLQGNEVMFSNNGFLVPGPDVLGPQGLLLPPGTELFTSAAPSYQAFFEGLLLEAESVDQLKPYL